MKTYDLIRLTILWAARISGTGVLAFVLFFISAHIFGNEAGPEKALTTTELLSVVFGISMLIGLFIALFKEGTGGLIATTSLLAFFSVRSDLISNPGLIGLFFVPCLLYLLFWIMNKKNSGPDLKPINN